MQLVDSVTRSHEPPPDPRGLSSAEAARLLAEHGPNEIRPRRAATRLRVLWRQLRSPLVLLLVFAAVVSTITGELADAAIVGAILGGSIGVGYGREHRAESAIAKLLERIQLATTVVRDGVARTVAVREVVPGDVVLLSAGAIVPGDGQLIEATELHVEEAVLTGESFPVHKQPPERVYFGTNVRSGTGRVAIAATGRATRYGAIAQRLATTAPQTEFERGLRRFGMLLLVAMLVMIIVVLAVNVLLGRPEIETLLFAIALAVGLSPELLPAIIGVNLAHAATRLAEAGVLVRRLDAIENLGSMTVLCTDKTGTLTEGVVRVAGAVDPAGVERDEVMELAALNAALQAGLANPIDDAILERRPFDRGRADKLAEVPYDFTRRRVSVVARTGEVTRLITKGAVAQLLDICTHLADGTPLDERVRGELEARVAVWGADGIRVLAVASRMVERQSSYGVDDERELGLAGFLLLADQPKQDAASALAHLRALGIGVKMITGDNHHVAHAIAARIGIGERMLTGEQLRELTDVALVRAAADTDVFAEVDPNQKERIVRALGRGGAVVGYFGDGVNDTPAMHAADVSISVEAAVDVAKATADLVLTQKSLEAIAHGAREGRRTFANTLKYILTTTSANLGNMVSMAVASLVLPFLPLTAGQVLLNNFLSDIPAVGMASDRVDPELVTEPLRWNTRFIGRFMLEFGLVSSLFDALTFVVLIGFASTALEFRTGWFVESLLTELAVALVVRTRRRSWQSRPGTLLLWTTAAVAAFALALPYLPPAAALGFVPPPLAIVLAVAGITVAYVMATELVKAWVFRRAPRRPPAIPLLPATA